MKDISKYSISELNAHAGDLPTLRFVLGPEHDDYVSELQKDKHKLAELLISAGVELIMLHKRHEKTMSAIQILLDNPTSIGTAAMKYIIDEDEKLRTRNDGVDTGEQEEPRSESALSGMQTIVHGDRKG